MSLSSEAVTSSWESGEKHRDRTGMAWPSRVCSRVPLSTSNRLMIPSTAPDATSLPSGLWGEEEEEEWHWNEKYSPLFHSTHCWVEEGWGGQSSIAGVHSMPHDIAHVLNTHTVPSVLIVTAGLQKCADKVYTGIHVWSTKTSLQSTVT